MTKDQLLQMRDRRPAMPERAEAGEVKIDRNQPPKMRAQEYLRQIKNPYAFKCGEVAVNIRFSSDGRSLKEALADYLAAAKKNPWGSFQERKGNPGGK